MQAEIFSEVRAVSDGSVGTDGTAAAACIVWNDLSLPTKVVTLIPFCRPDETEYFGGFIASALAKHLYRGTPFDWFCDHDGVRQKVQSDGFRCERLPNPRQVGPVRLSRGKTQRYHDRCHRGCTWVRYRGEKLLAERGEGFHGVRSTGVVSESSIPWCVLDARLAQGWFEDPDVRLEWLEQKFKLFFQGTAEN